MSPWKRRAKRDANEVELVRVIRQCGGQWLPLNVTDGPDGVIAHGGKLTPAEVKSATGKLRPGQEVFHQTWKGPPIQILRTVEDVVKLLQGDRAKA